MTNALARDADGAADCRAGASRCRFSVSVCVLVVFLCASDIVLAQRIDRRALVERHSVHYGEYTPEAPAQVGNGEFAFAFDITGLQTFPSQADGHVPLGTMAQWSWHAFPEGDEYVYRQTLREYDVHGRKVSYATDMRSEAAVALRSNPHRFNLARIALKLIDSQGSRAEVVDLESTSQTLSLLTGEANSRFEFEGHPVRVSTVAHPTLDAIAIEVKSPLVASGKVAIEISFAYPMGVWGPKVDNWEKPQVHDTDLKQLANGTRLVRTLDAMQYAADISTNGVLSATKVSHQFVVQQSTDQNLGLVVHFHRELDGVAEDLTVARVRNTAAEHWKKFWNQAGVIDLSESKDPRWRELERRIVLSQYLTAIQCAGSLPPQETGLLCNSWYGKSHLEMHWWHAAHFAFWGRFEHLERSLGWYEEIMPAARSIAERQGYRGVRWPKMTGPAGVSSPSEVGELLVWQQPHPIYFAELAYRNKPDAETLERYQALVEQTADFMADYAHFEASQDRYVLGPVLIPAQECYEGRSAAGVYNPTFELIYWRWALQTANLWRQRLDLPPNDHWKQVAEKIARPTVRNGVYTAIENAPYTRRRDHPSMLAALGVMPDVGLIDSGTMSRTMLDVEREWDWAETWGWDYPMMAMTAARLGNRSKAVDYLLLDTPKNRYLVNGHCYQEDRLPVYLPANGGLLAAVAMMSAGWDGSEPLGDAPGFPNDGSWTVRHEELRRMP
ncbi:Uncharacterized protein SCF082_LOCUS22168 [Durusdinium trenchii]|uniref:Glycoside hydrolase family 65 n=1 Tax=Durusdinium trenchii TaxID=1381693 RepID=A0ABP0LE76_9DINO